MLLRGITGAPGIAIGPVYSMHADQDSGRSDIDHDLAPIERLSVAQSRVALRLQELATELRAEGKAAEAAILEAQAMLTLDPALTSEVSRGLDAGAPLGAAVADATESMAGMLGDLDDPYLRERAADVRAVGAALLAALGGAEPDLDAPPGAIVVASDLTPAQTVTLRKWRIGGIATAGGTPMGHVAILARGLGLPAVVGLGEALLTVRDGAQAILAADEGRLILEPSPEAVLNYGARLGTLHESARELRSLQHHPSNLKDGHSVTLWANIGGPEEARFAMEAGAAGVGLFRTEFLFLDRATPPDEAEQLAAYASVLQALEGRPVIIRTIDVGGDKPIPYLPMIDEANPFLGTRGIRFGMRFPELFATQLRALLRAAPHGDLRIMLPMVSTLEDIAWAHSQLEDAASALRSERLDHRADVPLGVMLETPAAAVTLDLLAPHISFCSVGSNDLAQYTLAVDRTSGELARRYRADDPALFRLIRTAAGDAQRLGLEISLCGELAATPSTAVALVGLGIAKLSMAPGAILAVKSALRVVTLTEAQTAAAQACADDHARTGD